MLIHFRLSCSVPSCSDSAVSNKIAVINYAWTLSLQSQLLTVVTSRISFPPSWSVRTWRKNNQINVSFEEFKRKTRLWLTFWPWGVTYFMRNEKSCIQEIENQKEGVNGVNRLATKGENYYWLPTKRDKKYRLPTWTDIIYICLQKEEHIVP